MTDDSSWMLRWLKMVKSYDYLIKFYNFSLLRENGNYFFILDKNYQ